jgi:hypothetical protein
MSLILDKNPLAATLVMSSTSLPWMASGVRSSWVLSQAPLSLATSTAHQCATGLRPTKVGVRSLKKLTNPAYVTCAPLPSDPQQEKFCILAR